MTCRRKSNCCACNPAPMSENQTATCPFRLLLHLHLLCSDLPVPGSPPHHIEPFLSFAYHSTVMLCRVSCGCACAMPTTGLQDCCAAYDTCLRIEAGAFVCCSLRDHLQCAGLPPLLQTAESLTVEQKQHQQVQFCAVHTSAMRWAAVRPTSNTFPTARATCHACVATKSAAAPAGP